MLIFPEVDAYAYYVTHMAKPQARSCNSCKSVSVKNRGEPRDMGAIFSINGLSLGCFFAVLCVFINPSIHNFF